jgi:hypothetical protein
LRTWVSWAKPIVPVKTDLDEELGKRVGVKDVSRMLKTGKRGKRRKRQRSSQEERRQLGKSGTVWRRP